MIVRLSLTNAMFNKKDNLSHTEEADMKRATQIQPEAASTAAHDDGRSGAGAKAPSKKSFCTCRFFCLAVLPIC